ncbi:hypothetical protein [Legionella brunensis]|uniref:Uncharacterized protein n=1 Tax=Legionella brunensis TaxID=29422 RepID=A0A0W0STL2_9GAMM|nr:hypothetical protein [Legionella brunensis]KTC86731.1 hypothetical protein Lbru_0672 [Legionella brunensis]
MSKAQKEKLQSIVAKNANLEEANKEEKTITMASNHSTFFASVAQKSEEKEVAPSFEVKGNSGL